MTRFTLPGSTGFIVLATIVVAAQQPSSLPAGDPTAKVVYLRGNTVATATGDGANVRDLVADADHKWQPRWSPQGDRIAYRTPDTTAARAVSHATLRVIDTEGKPQASLPVYSTDPDGTLVGGMRFVEDSGWHSASAVFASGSVGPRSIEYRVIDLSGRVETSYFGTQFTPCPRTGRVAYVGEPGSGPDGRAIIEINGKPALTASSADAEIEMLRWTDDCQRLIVHEVRGETSRLIVLRNGTAEANLPLAKDLADGTFTPTRDAFLVSTTSLAFRYDPATRTLTAAAAAQREADARAAARATVMQRLGGGSPDWWSAAPR